jgi:hypothetical protein
MGRLRHPLAEHRRLVRPPLIPTHKKPKPRPMTTGASRSACRRPQAKFCLLRAACRVPRPACRLLSPWPDRICDIRRGKVQPNRKLHIVPVRPAARHPVDSRMQRVLQRRPRCRQLRCVLPQEIPAHPRLERKIRGCKAKQQQSNDRYRFHRHLRTRDTDVPRSYLDASRSLLTVEQTAAAIVNGVLTDSPPLAHPPCTIRKRKPASARASRFPIAISVSSPRSSSYSDLRTPASGLQTQYPLLPSSPPA